MVNLCDQSYRLASQHYIHCCIKDTQTCQKQCDTNKNLSLFLASSVSWRYTESNVNSNTPLLWQTACADDTLKVMLLVWQWMLAGDIVKVMSIDTQHSSGREHRHNESNVHSNMSLLQQSYWYTTCNADTSLFSYRQASNVKTHI